MILSIKDCKKVKKPWGHEIWIASDDNDSKYALKEIMIKTGFKSSIQFHEVKEETNYILSGEGILMLSKNKIDIEKFKKNKYTKEELQILVDDLVENKLSAGSVFHIKPGYIHRVISTNDLLMVETSTLDLDDVYRIQDDFNRGDGRIEEEHKK